MFGIIVLRDPKADALLILDCSSTLLSFLAAVVDFDLFGAFLIVDVLFKLGWAMDSAFNSQENKVTKNANLTRLALMRRFKRHTNRWAFFYVFGHQRAPPITAYLSRLPLVDSGEQNESGAAILIWLILRGYTESFCINISSYSIDHLPVAANVSAIYKNGTVRVLLMGGVVVCRNKRVGLIYG